MSSESITLLSNGFHVWEGDSNLDGSSPVADLLLNSQEICSKLVRSFSLIPQLLVAKLGEMLVEAQCGGLVVHTPTLGPAPEEKAAKVRGRCTASRAAIARRFFTLEGETRKTIFRDRQAVAYSTSLDVPESEHSEPAPRVQVTAGGDFHSQDCICEQHPASRALYLSREYGEPLYTEHEWDLLSSAFEHYNSLPSKQQKEQWLGKAGARQRALNSYLLLIDIAKGVESACPSERHYFGLESEVELSGSPEVSTSATVFRHGVENPKWGTIHGVIETQRETNYVSAPGQLEKVPVITFRKSTRPLSEKAIEEREAYEAREFYWARSPVVAGFSWDVGRGYLVDPALTLSDSNRSRLISQIEAETARRKQYGDVWHSNVRPTITRRRKDGSKYQTLGQSRFYKLQQQKQAYAARRRRELVAILVREIGLAITDPRVVARIEELGYDSALTAIQKVAAERGISTPEVRTTILV